MLYYRSQSTAGSFQIYSIYVYINNFVLIIYYLIRFH